MLSQKYSTRKGLSRLSRNQYNLGISYNIPSRSSLSKPLLPLIIPSIGPAFIDKNSDNIQNLTKWYSSTFSAHQIIKHYYGGLNKKQLRSPLTVLESRLDVLFFRSGLPVSIFESRHLIKKGVVKVNGKVNKNIFALIKVGSVLEIQHSKAIGQKSRICDNLSVKRIDDNNTLVFFRDPISKDSISLPKNLNPKIVQNAGLLS